MEWDKLGMILKGQDEIPVVILSYRLPAYWRETWYKGTQKLSYVNLQLPQNKFN